MKLELPIKFSPDFCDKKDYYYQPKGVARNNLISALMEASQNYCMYTFESIKCGTEEFIGDVEHSIEKSEYKDSGINPFNCKFNLSASTRIANQKYKKGIVAVTQGVKFDCDAKYSCKKPCSSLIKSHVDSINLNKYILMPNTFSSHLNLAECNLDFCLIRLSFKPSETGTVFSEILRNHIDTFKLNENNDISAEIVNICEVIIECGILPLAYDSKKTSNFTTKVFISFLRKYNKNKCLSIARLIHKNSKINLPIIKSSLPSPKKNNLVPDHCTYLTPEIYGVAKRRFNDKLIIQKYYGVVYPFTKR
jgi:hypothetical protein